MGNASDRYCSDGLRGHIVNCRWVDMVFLSAQGNWNFLKTGRNS